MMLRRFNRVGPWLLLSAVGWYLAGCFLANHLSTESMASASQSRKNLTDIDDGTTSAWRIRVTAPSDYSYYYPKITLVYDASIARTTIKNDDAGASIDARRVDGVLDILVNKHTARRERATETMTIRLPQKTGTVSFSGNMNVFISGNTPALTLVALDQKPVIAIDALAANTLRYVANFDSAQDHAGRESSFTLDKDAAIRELEISMSHGTLDFSAQSLPAKTTLDLGNDVKVRSDAPFLQSATFGKLTP